MEISKSKIEVIKLALPNIEEQKYISDVLSKIDNRINIYENKRIGLHQLKRVLMEELLTGKKRVNTH